MFVNERAPCARTVTVALKAGDQTYVRETDFRFAVFFGNLKHNVCAGPLTFLFHKS